MQKYDIKIRQFFFFNTFLLIESTQTTHRQNPNLMIENCGKDLREFSLLRMNQGPLIIILLSRHPHRVRAVLLLCGDFFFIFLFIYSQSDGLVQVRDRGSRDWTTSEVSVRCRDPEKARRKER